MGSTDKEGRSGKVFPKRLTSWACVTVLLSCEEDKLKTKLVIFLCNLEQESNGAA